MSRFHTILLREMFVPSKKLHVKKRKYKRKSSPQFDGDVLIMQMDLYKRLVEWYAYDGRALSYEEYECCMNKAREMVLDATKSAKEIDEIRILSRNLNINK